MKVKNSNKKKRDLRKARIFSNIFRNIVNICTSNSNEFDSSYNDICSHKLELKKENEDPCQTSFFDLSAKVRNRKLSTELFVERDAFYFLDQSHVIFG